MSCIFLCFFYFPSFSEYHFDGVPALNEKLFVKCFVKCTNFVIPKANTANNNNLEVTVSNIKMNHIVTFIKKKQILKICCLQWWEIQMNRSSPPDMFLGKGILNICSKFVEKKNA